MAISRAHPCLLRVGIAADLPNLRQSRKHLGRVFHPSQIGRRLELQSRSRNGHDQRIDEGILKIRAQRLGGRPGGTAIDAAGAADRDLRQLVSAQSTDDDRDDPQPYHSARVRRNPGPELVKSRIHR